ncbi:hypothetical protein IW140_001614 [Coemansia sp. RSA 1813]|nr:hypothetical protein EV178_001625 [Coemansia sp. RSA 1646]KAJ1773453.1 hypothetical protein LPJ74_000706 [Coemansia sp. RSA 1843]KAJ2091292.1 hypothetical protein IW138_001991 [Coemansia sp. RSA 986]KAJ2216483.1 hypothetical protein EV179_001278 [Coemansia sp. RSA 487]KAJ2571434.1 hypothetical protein IW140_001614 [Coemansia sp. RSA 1813]
MFSPYSTNASGDMRAKKRRCPVCGTKRMTARDDGRVTCKYGHEQAGIFEESAELLVAGSTRRRVVRTKRESKKKKAQSRRLYGRNAHFLILQGMQHILKLQAETLVRDLGAPEGLVGVVRNIWLLYIGQLDDQDSLDDIHQQDQQNSEEQASLSASVTQTQHQHTLTANSLYTQHLTQTQDIPPVDDSIDELLKQIDADIADDEEEFVAWQRRNEKRVSSFLNESHGLSTEQLVGAEATADLAAECSSKISLRGGSILMKEIRRFVRMEYLPAILYLAFLWVKTPILYGDLYYIIAEERIPYVSAYLRLPHEIYSRLGQGMASIFMVPFAPSVEKTKTLAAAFQKLFLTTMGIAFPQQNLPQQMLMLVKRLGLPLEIYQMATRAMELVGERIHLRINRTGIATVSMAAIVVCLKLHYGLDEIERKLSSVDSEQKLNLPPLREFLDTWRDSWESELSIGTIPYLTAYGEHWPHEFAEYYRRIVSRDQVRMYRAVYSDISRQYRNAIDELATSDQVDHPQTMLTMVPYEYMHRRQQQEKEEKLKLQLDKLKRQQRERQQLKEQQEQQESQKKKRSYPFKGPAIDPTIVKEIEKYIEPVRISAVYSKNTKDTMRIRKQLFPTIVEPLTPHLQIQLEHGEKNMVLYSRHHLNVYGDGYTMPTFGLIVARCAMILGCNPDELIRSVTLLEYELIYATNEKMPFWEHKPKMSV